ncbi:MAG TPA: leucyl/phenylalanyl-tRNA--protein transferase [Myxococcaceae bacterium]|nr:leucyl/phenylalanyl-tRNA--protein transferase [Myxococcaceae bacterium]
MPIFLLNEDEEAFPPQALTDPSGILAVGGDLSPRRLLNAYARGIFPWYSDGQPILWHCPNPRFVLEPTRLHVPKSLRKTLRRGTFELRFDTAFADVISHCADARRPGQRGTWITDDMREAYIELHRLGFAHSAESWSEGKLVGGLYGVSLGSVFFGESMFALAPDASKAAFIVLVEHLVGWGFTLIDCQQETEHLARFGAEAWPRERFLEALEQGLQHPTRRGSWSGLATGGPTGDSGAGED